MTRSKMLSLTFWLPNLKNTSKKICVANLKFDKKSFKDLKEELHYIFVFNTIYARLFV